MLFVKSNCRPADLLTHTKPSSARFGVVIPIISFPLQEASGYATLAGEQDVYRCSEGWRWPRASILYNASTAERKRAIDRAIATAAGLTMHRVVHLQSALAFAP